MATDPAEGRVPMSQTRQVAIEALCEQFANDAIPVEEFERRVEAAHRAESVDALKELLRDLPGANLPAAPSNRGAPAHASAGAPGSRTGEATALAPRLHPLPRLAAPHEVKEQAFVVGIMGGSSRTGPWVPARNTYTIAVMGGHELDFREARFAPGVTEVYVFAVMGGVEIIVPPWLNVDSSGFALMGGFEHAADSSLPPDPDGPTLRISGFALMGGVGITVRQPGESEKDAKRRRKLEREDRRRLGPGS